MSDSGYPPPPPPPGPQDGGQHYGQMPSMPAPGDVAAGPVTRPPAMDQAVLLMKVGAGLSVLSLILTFAMGGATRDAIEKAGRTAKPPLTAAQIDTAVTAATAIGIVAGLLGAVLWLWMASANGNGKKWARTVATIFFAISVLGLLSSFVQSTAVLTIALSFVQVALGAFIIFLLYKRESTAFYQAASAPRM